MRSESRETFHERKPCRNLIAVTDPFSPFGAEDPSHSLTLFKASQSGPFEALLRPFWCPSEDNKSSLFKPQVQVIGANWMHHNVLSPRPWKNEARRDEDPTHPLWDEKKVTPLYIAHGRHISLPGDTGCYWWKDFCLLYSLVPTRGF